MALTQAQLATFKSSIQGNTTPIPAGRPFAGTAINALPNTDDANTEIANWYNLTASPSYTVWNTAVPIKAIRAAVNLQQYTPTDSPPAASGNAQGTNDALLYNNRALMCQLKQANAIFLIQGEGSVDCSPLQLRQSFNDCMTTIPSGSGGGNQNAGWGTSAAPGAVRLAMHRQATNGEKVFVVASTAAPNAGNVGADARGGATNPDTLVHVGSIELADVEAARNLP
jgi:hypothetical protein